MHYTVSDFNGETFTPDTLENTVKKKIALLYDMHILKKGKGHTPDPRTATVQKILLTYKTTAEIDAALHNVVRLNETLDNFIARKGE